MAETKSSSQLLRIGAPIYGIFAGLYVIIYLVQPFTELWNDFGLDLLIILAAILAAVMATYVWQQFQSIDAPKRVWQYFALGLWCFAIARTIVLAYFLAYGDEYPLINLADIFYFSGVIVFALSLVFQFRLIFGSLQERKALVVIIVVTLLGSLLGAYFLSSAGTRMGFWTAYLQAFYFLCGIGIVSAAFRLSRIFGRGMWGRAWWGILIFVIAHFIKTLLAASGLYAAGVAQGNLLSLLADLMYMTAYLMVALACYSQYLLVRFGPTLRAQTKQETADGW